MRIKRVKSRNDCLLRAMWYHTFAIHNKHSRKSISPSISPFPTPPAPTMFVPSASHARDASFKFYRSLPNPLHDFHLHLHLPPPPTLNSQLNSHNAHAHSPPRFTPRRPRARHHHGRRHPPPPLPRLIHIRASPRLRPHPRPSSPPRHFLPPHLSDPLRPRNPTSPHSNSPSHNPHLSPTPSRTHPHPEFRSPTPIASPFPASLSSGSGQYRVYTLFR